MSCAEGYAMSHDDGLGRMLTPPPERGVHAASTPECQALLVGVKALWIADVEAA